MWGNYVAWEGVGRNSHAKRRVHKTGAGCVTELAGKSDLDQARADMIVDCLDDATKPFFYPAFVMNPDADAKVCCYMAVIGGPLYFCPVVSFYLSIFFFFSSPNLSGHRLDLYHTSTHGVALMRI